MNLKRDCLEASLKLRESLNDTGVCYTGQANPIVSYRVKIKQKWKIRGHSQKIDSAHLLSRERVRYYLQ